MDLGRLSQIFRFTGDALMIGSRAVLIKKIRDTNSVSGLSLQTQVIYLIAYMFRYLDIFSLGGRFSVLRIYNTVMKVVFICYQMYIVFLIAVQHRGTYNRRFDNFRLPVLFGIAFLIAPFVKGETFTLGSYLEEYLYTVSLILEAVAILPQLVMIQEAGDCETLTSRYILMLGLYRLNYAVYFVLKYMSGRGLDFLILITSLIQTGLYADFFAVYYRHVTKNIRFSVTRKL